MHETLNPGVFKPKSEFNNEFMSIYPADLKVPLADPPAASAKAKYKTDTDAIYQ